MRRSAVVLAFLLASCATGSAGPETEAAPDLTPGGVFDTTPQGYELILDSFTGMPLVVNFWATWCTPCVDELPRLVEAARQYDGRARFLGVDVEDDADAAERFLARFGVTYPSLGDPKGDIKRAERIVGLPTTRFYRADGELAFVHSGEISSEQLTERIEELIRVGMPASPPSS